MVKEGFRTDGFLVVVIVSIVAFVALVLLVANISDLGESSVVGFKIAPSNMVSSKDLFNPKEVNMFMNCVFDYSKSCRDQDFNMDGVVNVLDFVISSNFGGSSSDFRSGIASLSIQNVNVNADGSGTLDVYMVNDADVGGFQFELFGVNITGLSGGSMTAADFYFEISSTMVLAVSFDGTLIPSGNGLLTTVSFSVYDGETICFGTNPNNNVISDSTGWDPLNTTWGDCYCGILGCWWPGYNKLDACGLYQGSQRWTWNPDYCEDYPYEYNHYCTDEDGEVPGVCEMCGGGDDGSGEGDHTGFHWGGCSCTSTSECGIQGSFSECVNNPELCQGRVMTYAGSTGYSTPTICSPSSCADDYTDLYGNVHLGDTYSCGSGLTWRTNNCVQCVVDEDCEFLIEKGWLPEERSNCSTGGLSGGASPPICV